MPRCSVLEASWLYSEGAERLDALPRAPTVAAKVRMCACVPACPCACVPVAAAVRGAASARVSRLQPCV